MNAPYKKKTVSPWNLKVGMMLAPLTQSWDGNDYHVGRITEIAKGRGVFTGGSVWRVKTDMGESLQYFGKSRQSPAERITILV